MSTSKMAVKATKIAFDLLNERALTNPEFIEYFLLPSLGLNNEVLNEQPKELMHYMGHGLGLKIWQYPHQFSKYIEFISRYAKEINSYMEIGCRNGGTFVFHTELLRTLNPSGFQRSVAVDIIDRSELLTEYTLSTLIAEYLKMNSLSPEFSSYVSKNRFDLVFIDGDHSYQGVKNDAIISAQVAKIMVFHDITSDICPGVGAYWRELMSVSSETYEFYEFIDQYDSVNGTFLGIGVAVRKDIN